MGATPAWVTAMRQVIRSEGFRDGWSVLERRSRVQIQRSWLGPGGTRHKKGISTQIRWQEGCTSAVLAALTQIKAGLDRSQLDKPPPSSSPKKPFSTIGGRASTGSRRGEVAGRQALPGNEGLHLRPPGPQTHGVRARRTHQRPENGKAFARLAFNPQGDIRRDRHPVRST